MLRWRGIVKDKGEEGVRAGVLRLVVEVIVGDTGDSPASSRSRRRDSKVVNKLRGAGAGERVEMGAGVDVGVGSSISVEWST